VFFLVYVSAAGTWFSAQELRELLARSRAHNEREGITGMLLYKNGNFMQALEGDESLVRALHSRITADRRHHGVVTIASGTTDRRQFADWSMGFVDLDAGAGSLPAGYTGFLDQPLSDPSWAQSPGRCWELLQLFSRIQ
jgi:hypothetical protein